MMQSRGEKMQGRFGVIKEGVEKVYEIKQICLRYKNASSTSCDGKDFCQHYLFFHMQFFWGHTFFFKKDQPNKRYNNEHIKAHHLHDAPFKNIVYQKNT